VLGVGEKQEEGEVGGGGRCRVGLNVQSVSREVGGGKLGARLVGLER